MDDADCSGIICTENCGNISFIVHQNIGTLIAAIGRKMDFLVQEINREINTIGSKAQDIEIARCVVDVKAEIEKIREQIQNIE